MVEEERSRKVAKQYLAGQEANENRSDRTNGSVLQFENNISREIYFRFLAAMTGHMSNAVFRQSLACDCGIS
jgi:hypothetical protein